MKSLSVLVLLALIIPIISSLELLALTEHETYPLIPADPFVNITWLKSVDRWYAPLWSKRNLYSTVEEVIGSEEFVYLEDADLTKACIRIGSLGSDPVNYEIFGHSFTVAGGYFNPIRPGFIDWPLKNGSVKQSIIVSSDNKSYAVAVNIFPDGGVGFVVYSTQTSIESKLKAIQKKLLATGFKEEAFYHVNADCDTTETNKHKSEL